MSKHLQLYYQIGHSLLWLLRIFTTSLFQSKKQQTVLIAEIMLFMVFKGGQQQKEVRVILGIFL